MHVRCTKHGHFAASHINCPLCRQENIALRAVQSEIKKPADAITGYDAQQVENELLYHFPTISQDRAAELRREAEVKIA